MSRYFISVFSCLLVCQILLSCGDSEEENQAQNLSDDYSFCNNQLVSCSTGSADYCLFGLKWGENNDFEEIGSNSNGPGVGGGTISYSFQESNGFVNTHRQINLQSESFDQILDCAKEEIRRAVLAWEGTANLSFEELVPNSDSDIKFYVADIVQSGIGYPNYVDQLCMEIAGNIVIQAGDGISDCDKFHLFILHELGHVLGLGHVATPNVMNSRVFDFGFNSLQRGDSLGIVEIYGEK